MIHKVSFYDTFFFGHITVRAQIQLITWEAVTIFKDLRMTAKFFIL